MVFDIFEDSGDKVVLCLGAETEPSVDHRKMLVVPIHGLGQMQAIHLTNPNLFWCSKKIKLCGFLANIFFAFVVQLGLSFIFPMSCTTVYIIQTIPKSWFMVSVAELEFFYISCFLLYSNPFTTILTFLL